MKSVNVCKKDCDHLYCDFDRIPNEALTASIKEELKGRIVHFGDKISSFVAEDLTKFVDYIHICEFDKVKSNEIGELGPSEIFADNFTIDPDLLKIHFYRLNKEGPQSESISEENENTLAAKYTILPSTHYEGLWETLIFDSNVKEDLLQYAQAMLYYSERGVDPGLVSCNRVLLLHGPPGTGKTSLSKALAQKLSIRLTGTFNEGVLIEINTHSLFSKYFSESGKLVSKMFEKIIEMAVECKTLLCVLVDEVESLTHCRETASSANEPSDALRVVNAVLTHLDLLSRYPNVLVFTTSNITKTVDRAFLDRADLRVFIPNPSPYGIYSIYYSCIAELIKKGIILGPGPQKLLNKKVFDEINVNIGLDCTKELISLAKESHGLSGRALRKVPLRVHATLLLPKDHTPLMKFLQAMFQAVKNIKEEVLTCQEAHLNLS